MSIINHLPKWFQQEEVTVSWTEKPVPVTNGWQLCNLDKKKVTEITYQGSACTDWICEAISGKISSTLIEDYKLTRPFFLYINKSCLNEQNWKAQKEFLHKIETLNGLKKTRAFLFKHKLFLIPDKRICQSSALTSFYTKFIRNLVNLTVLPTTAVDFHQAFWTSDILLRNKLLTKIIFSGKLLDISKDIPNPGGLIKVKPTHNNLGIYWNLVASADPVERPYYKHAQNIADLQKQLEGIALNALPSL